MSSDIKQFQKWKNKRGSLIMALHEIQERYGYVAREEALALATALDVPLARIYEILSFYNFFKLQPPGKVIISVCTGTACHLKGANEIVETLKKCLNIELETPTPDNLFYVQCVRCIGCCGLAPAIMVNGKVYGKVKPSEIPMILAEWRQLTTEKEGGTSR